MVLDGLLADVQCGGDLLVEIALRDELEDLGLPGGQRREHALRLGIERKLLELLQDLLGHLRLGVQALVDGIGPIRDLDNGLDDFLGPGLLAQVGGSLRFERQEKLFVTGVG